MHSALRVFQIGLAGILMLQACSAAAFGIPVMVKDINPGPASSAPQKLLVLGHQLFFVGTNGISGVEPMVSDGTAIHTTLLRDVTPGPLSGIVPGCPTCNAIAAGTNVYFSASDGAAAQLWKTDGTAAGTVKVYAGASASDLVAAGSQIYFAGTPNGSSLAFLYRSDGSTVGTGQVSATTLLSGNNMYAFQGAPYFPADDMSTGLELWTSNGTAPGTVVVSDLAPGSSSAYPSLLTQVGNALFFSGSNGSGPGLCVSNGTTPGTSYLKQVRVGTLDATRGQIVDLNGKALFIGNDNVHGLELWSSNGTTAGAVMVKDVYPGSPGGLDGSSLVVMGNAVYFAANDGVHATELWKSDGTAAGTVMVKDIYPQFGAFGPSNPAGLANIRGTLFFRATSGGVSGTQPWVSDGTEAGTVQLGVVYPGGASQADGFTEVDGTVYFSATDGVHGVELWSVSGATAGVGPESEGTHGAVLFAPRPNPARASARIAFALSSAQRVRLVLFDMAGRVVRVLEDGELGAGPHEVVVDGAALPSGVYGYRLETASGSLQRKLLLTH